jgi:ADP-ribosylglycohydrolase
MEKNLDYLRDKFAGVVFGTAIGDALGYQCEFDKSIQPVTDLPSGGRYSDDTQMFRAVLEGLLRARPKVMLFGDEIERSAQEVAEEFIAWSESPENNRAPGASCMMGCRNLKDGVPWFKAGKPNGGGCGAAMRSMAYGMWFWNLVGNAAELAAEHALMTHQSKMAQASAAAVAAGVSAGIMGLSPWEMVDRMAGMAHNYDEKTADMIREAYFAAVMSLTHEDEKYSRKVILDKWRGWAGHEAVAAAVYCFIRSPSNFKGAVLPAVNSPGDSDSLGAITGALVGSHVGLKGIPGTWVNRVEKTEQLVAYAGRVIQAKGYTEHTLSQDLAHP